MKLYAELDPAMLVTPATPPIPAAAFKKSLLLVQCLFKLGWHIHYLCVMVFKLEI